MNPSIERSSWLKLINFETIQETNSCHQNRISILYSVYWTSDPKGQKIYFRYTVTQSTCQRDLFEFYWTNLHSHCVKMTSIVVSTRVIIPKFGQFIVQYKNLAFTCNQTLPRYQKIKEKTKPMITYPFSKNHFEWEKHLNMRNWQQPLWSMYENQHLIKCV